MTHCLFCPHHSKFKFQIHAPNILKGSYCLLLIPKEINPLFQECYPEIKDGKMGEIETETVQDFILG